MHQFTYCLLLTTILYGCGGSHQSTTGQTEAKQDMPDTTKTVTASEVDTLSVQPPTDTRRTLLTKAAPVTLSMRLDSLHATVICAVEITKPGLLTAELRPERSAGNIRFSQIYLPNGATDGPFGRSLSKEITQAGVIQLRIGPSQMANNPYRGKFSIRLQMK